MTLTTRQLSQLAAVVVLSCLVVAPVAGLGYVAIQTIASNRGELEEKAALLQRFEIASRRDASVSDDAAARQEALRAPDFLKGPNESLLLAGLQSRVRGFVQQFEVVLVGTQNLPRREIDKISYIGATFQIQASVQGVAALLDAIERARPLLFVERMSMAPLSRHDANGSGPAARRNGGMLSATIDVYGAAWPEAK